MLNSAEESADLYGQELNYVRKKSVELVNKNAELCGGKSDKLCGRKC